MMMITWWMKLGGNRPPGDNPLLFSISGTGSFICPVAQTRLDIPKPLNYPLMGHWGKAEVFNSTTRYQLSQPAPPAGHTKYIHYMVRSYQSKTGRRRWEDDKNVEPAHSSISKQADNGKTNVVWQHQDDDKKILSWTVVVQEWNAADVACQPLDCLRRRSQLKRYKRWSVPADNVRASSK